MQRMEIGFRLTRSFYAKATSSYMSYMRYMSYIGYIGYIKLRRN